MKNILSMEWKKKLHLCKLFLKFELNDLNLQFLTSGESSDLGGQNNIAYFTSRGYMSVHAKICVPVFCG